MTDKTIQFSIKEDSDAEMRKILGEVYTALKEKGYNPISQIVGYLLSEDPTTRRTSPPTTTRAASSGKSIAMN